GCYGRYRRAPVIPQQNLRTLNTACGFRTGLDQLLQHPNFLIAKHQLGAFAGEGHCGGPLQIVYPAAYTTIGGIATLFWNRSTSFWLETKDPEGVKQDSPGREPWVQGPDCGKT